MIYLDTSFLMPLFREEAVSQKVEKFLAARTDTSFAVSQWTRVEFASVIARDVRMKKLGEVPALKLIDEFDALVGGSFYLWHPAAADFDLARDYVGDFSTRLRGPDALHLAIARNNRAEEFLTLDEDLLFAAKRLKIRAGRGIRL